MEKIHILILLIFSMLSVAMLSVPVAYSQAKVVAIDLTPGRVKDIESEFSQKLLGWLEGNLTAQGYTVKELTEVTSASLKGVDALVIGKLKDEKGAFSSAEVEAIRNWFKEGGKFLWIGADSDYVEPYLNPEDTSFKAGEPNKILEAIGSHLRLEYGSLEDPNPEANAGAAYRVVSFEANTAGLAGKITANAPKVLFHGPTFVVGFKQGKYVPFSEVASENVVWLYRSSSDGTVVSHDGVDPKAVSVGQTGKFVEAAAETIKTNGKFSKVLVTGESLTGDRNVFNTEYHGVKLQGPTFVLQAFAWGTTVEEAPTPVTTYIAIVIVIVIIIAVIAAFLMKRKKK